MIKCDATVNEVFERANKACKKNGLKNIETIFLFREILKEKDCILSEYLENKHGIKRKEIEEALEQCIKERLKQPKRKSEVCFSTPERHNWGYEVTEELIYILKYWLSNVRLYDKQYVQQQFGKNMHTIVEPDSLLGCMLIVMPDDIDNFIKKMKLIPMQVKTDLKQKCLDNGLRIKSSLPVASLPAISKVATSSTSQKDKSLIPKEMKSFLKEITVPEGEDNLILGRDKETKQLWSIMSKKNKRNVILVGGAGVGKSALAIKLAEDIKYHKCPAKFESYKIITLDMTGLIAGTTLRGQAEERFARVKDFLQKNEEVILFIDEIHTMLGAGSCGHGEMDLANSLKPVLASDKGTVIGATTDVEYEKYFSKDVALKRRFEKVEVKEPKANQVYPMLKAQIASLEEYHGVKISKKVVDYIIFTASCFNHETRNPDRTLDLIDRAMVAAEISGNRNVTKKNVLENFNANFERFNKMSVERKKALAYHEAGHFVMHEMSGVLKSTAVTAVSIIPADDYLGVNIMEKTEETAYSNIEYFIDMIAADLAGREAERLVTKDISSGASEDLKNATTRAYNVVAKYAMLPGYGISYLNDDNYKLISEETTNKISYEVDNLLRKATKRAQEVLTKHRALLDKVVEELLKEKMLPRSELERLVKQHTTEIGVETTVVK